MNKIDISHNIDSELKFKYITIITDELRGQKFEQFYCNNKIHEELNKFDNYTNDINADQNRNSIIRLKDKCTFHSTRFQKVKRHLLSFQMYRFKCDQCTASYTREDRVKRHMKTKHCD